MIKKCIILIYLLQSGILIQAQDTLNYKSIIQCSFLTGVSLPITGTSTESVKDYTINYRDKSVRLNASITYFLNRKWGIISGINIYRGIEMNSKANLLINLKSEYPNNYIYEISEPSNLKPSSDFFNYYSYMAGVITRYENGRFYFYPSLLFGAFNFQNMPVRAYIKRKDSNMQNELFYQTIRFRKNPFTMNLSASLGYKISKTLWIGMDGGINWFKADVTFSKTYTNLFENIKITDYSILDKQVFSTCISLNLKYALYN